MKIRGRGAGKGVLLLAVGLPLLARAQAPGAYGGDLDGGLNGVLERLFDQMIPLAGRLIGVAQAIAGFAALWYIAARVWKHIARAEPIDFYPLLRPFALGLAIMFFMPLVSLMNGVLQPVVTGTRVLAADSQKAVYRHLAEQEKAAQKAPPVGIIMPSEANTGQYERPDGTSDGKGFSSGLKDSFSFLNIKNTFKTVMISLVGILYEAAALCVNLIRTFYLIVLVILGPVVLGLSVFDGFQQSLSGWFARYVHVYMWLPVANIFGAITGRILDNMMNMDQDFFSSTAYVIFMIISVVGYTTVPGIAGHIVHVGSRNPLLHKVNAVSRQAGRAVSGGV